MEELIRAIETQMGAGSLGGIPEFEAAAKKWAVWSLENHVGKTLDFALEISKAMVTYAADLRGENTR